MGIPTGCTFATVVFGSWVPNDTQPMSQKLPSRKDRRKVFPSQSNDVTYDGNTNRLYFRAGSFWLMGCVSFGTEQDGGTYYPTTMQDTNGNQINIIYYPGVGAPSYSTSGRIAWIED